MNFRLTRAVKWLMIACFGMFLVQQTADQFFGGNVIGWLALVPSAFVIDHRFWQIFTYAFLHGDVMHLFLNLLMLAFIGSELESLWGIRRFLKYYFFCSVSAGALYLILQLLIWRGEGLHVPMVGASGAIYGLLMAYGLIFGERVLLFMLMFPMKAKHFVWILAGLEFLTTVYSSRGMGALASAAHLGGMIAGFGYLWVRATMQLAKKRRQSGPEGRGQGPAVKTKRRRSHLKLIIDNERDLNRLMEEEDTGEGPKTWH
jgi:membrane associated rhomboid family serine protease